MQVEKNSALFEVWADTVSLRDLLVSILISLVLGLGGYLLAPPRPPLPLIVGLAGTSVAFVISSLVFKQKRRLTVREED